MIGGRGFEPGRNEINMALAPRQTGSSAKLYILAAALQAGAESEDIVDGFTPCSFPIPDQPGETFDITAAVGGGLLPLEENTFRSINCAFARLSQIVGLHRVVDTTYRMAESPYLFKGQSPDDRGTIDPILSFATGGNELSPLDMASGAQTIANEGVHHEPYYVDRVETETGRVLYTHFDGGSQVLERDVALKAIGILKQVLGPGGTGYRYPLADDRPAAGKTGTQVENTNATFVGFTPQLTTAVWMGDPNGYTPMDPANVPELPENVQGGRLPTLIWKTYMDAALAGRPKLDWAPPPAPERPPARLFLPGLECVSRVVRYETKVIGYGWAPLTPGTDPKPKPTNPPPTRTSPPPSDKPTTTAPPEEPTTSSSRPPESQPTQARPPLPPPPPSPPQPTAPPVTQAPVPITEVVPVYDDLVATTIAPDVLNPNAPMPSVPVNQPVRSC